MKPANFSPVYCALYPQLAGIARSHGYNMGVHGSMARDFDLLCVPWTDNVSHPQLVVDEICSRFVIQQLGSFEQKKHGRIAYSISVAFGECAIDLSFVNAPLDNAPTLDQRFQKLLVLSQSDPTGAYNMPVEIMSYLSSKYIWPTGKAPNPERSYLINGHWHHAGDTA